MTQLTIGYSDSEDRLWLLLSSDDAQFWLTRRFCSNLIKHLAQALTDSCPGAEFSASLDASVRVALEHQAAHEAQQEAGPAAPVSEPANNAARHSVLLSSVLLTAAPTKIELEMIGANYTRTLYLNRAEAHQLLSALWQRCEGAQWAMQAPQWILHLAQ